MSILKEKKGRVYLDHNATTPLRPEARAAMLEAMDVVGNPSSVHAEGRVAKGIVERARGQVAALVGCEVTQVVFTGSATEAAALAVAQKGRHGGRFAALPTEHDCFFDWTDFEPESVFEKTGSISQTAVGALYGALAAFGFDRSGVEQQASALLALSGANSETGLMFPRPDVPGSFGTGGHTAVVCDITQVCGKTAVVFADKWPAYAVLSAHKFGGPKGVGALINFTSEDPEAILKGGGQEMGRRSGTENVIGIAGFGAAAEAAKRDVDAGKWGRVEKLRNILEKALADISRQTIFVGKDVPRLPNTSCFITPGWKGETQVMQMDLAGFAISAGSACSSGKVKSSRVLRAMGFSEEEAASAVRVSLGLETTEDDVMRFVEAWGRAFEKQRARAQ